MKYFFLAAPFTSFAMHITVIISVVTLTVV